jgi:hypothetical protein
MAEVTYFVALPFVAVDDGIAAGEPTECFNPNAAVIAPRRFRARKATSARSQFSRTDDAANGNFSDAKVIWKFGDVPDDLSTL